MACAACLYCFHPVSPVCTPPVAVHGGGRQPRPYGPLRVGIGLALVGARAAAGRGRPAGRGVPDPRLRAGRRLGRHRVAGGLLSHRRRAVFSSPAAGRAAAAGPMPPAAPPLWPPRGLPGPFCAQDGERRRRRLCRPYRPAGAGGANRRRPDRPAPHRARHDRRPAGRRHLYRLLSGGGLLPAGVLRRARPG